MWQKSDRLPNCGICKLQDDVTLGHDKAGDLCILEFWRMANSAEPTRNHRILVTPGAGSRPTIAALPLRNGSTLRLSID